MATDKIKGDVVFICDDCDDTLETDTPDFDEANSIRQREKWVVQRLAGGAWTHYCPRCADR